MPNESSTLAAPGAALIALNSVVFFVILFIVASVKLGIVKRENHGIIAFFQWQHIIFWTGKMAKVCDICGKKPMFGNNVSHAHNTTRRRWNPNLKRVRAVQGNGSVKRIDVCVRCLTSGKVLKPA